MSISHTKDIPVNCQSERLLVNQSQITKESVRLQVNHSVQWSVRKVTSQLVTESYHQAVNQVSHAVNSTSQDNKSILQINCHSAMSLARSVSNKSVQFNCISEKSLQSGSWSVSQVDSRHSARSVSHKSIIQLYCASGSSLVSKSVSQVCRRTVVSVNKQINSSVQLLVRQVTCTLVSQSSLQAVSQVSQLVISQLFSSVRLSARSIVNESVSQKGHQLVSYVIQSQIKRSGQLTVRKITSYSGDYAVSEVSLSLVNLSVEFKCILIGHLKCQQ